jgi:hypothetical protein
VTFIAARDYDAVDSVVPAGTNDLHAIAFSRDGRVLAMAGTRIEVVDVAKREIVKGSGHRIGTQLGGANT